MRPICPKKVPCSWRARPLPRVARSLTRATLGVGVSLCHPDSPTAAHAFLTCDSRFRRHPRRPYRSDCQGSTIVAAFPMLVIVDDEALGTLRLPNHAHADFVCPTATPNELKGSCAAPHGRGRRLSPPMTCSTSITSEINLATYQVTLDDEPIDSDTDGVLVAELLATHPNRAYSREVLLHVWGWFRHAYRRRAHPSHPLQGGVRRSRRTLPQSAAWATCLRTRFPPQRGQAPLWWFLPQVRVPFGFATKNLSLPKIAFFIHVRPHIGVQLNVISMMAPPHVYGDFG